MSKVKKMEVTPKAITKDELKKVTDSANRVAILFS